MGLSRCVTFLLNLRFGNPEVQHATTEVMKKSLSGLRQPSVFIPDPETRSAAHLLYPTDLLSDTPTAVTLSVTLALKKSVLQVLKTCSAPSSVSTECDVTRLVGRAHRLTLVYVIPEESKQQCEGITVVLQQ